MKTQITFTSTIPKNLMQELSHYAQNLKLNKKEIIVIALEKYFEELKKDAYKASFKRAALDMEQKQLAEEGLVDYVKYLDKF
jgi:hypothetical protein